MQCYKAIMRKVSTSLHNNAATTTTKKQRQNDGNLRKWKLNLIKDQKQKL